MPKAVQGAAKSRESRYSGRLQSAPASDASHGSSKTANTDGLRNIGPSQFGLRILSQLSWFSDLSHGPSFTRSRSRKPTNMSGRPARQFSRQIRTVHRLTPRLRTVQQAHLTKSERFRAQ